MCPSQSVYESHLPAGVRVREPPLRLEVAQRVRGYASQREKLRDALAPVAQEPVPAELSLARLIEARRRPISISWRSVAAAIALVVLRAALGS
jgi:anti-sigma factor RsiW